MSSPVLSDITESDLTSSSPPDFVPDPPAQVQTTTNDVMDMLRTIQAKLDNAEREREDMKKSIKELGNENKYLKTKVKKLEDTVAKQNIEIIEHGHTMASLVSSLENIPNQIERLKEKIKKYEASAQFTANELQILKIDNASLGKRVDDSLQQKKVTEEALAEEKERGRLLESTLQSIQIMGLKPKTDVKDMEERLTCMICFDAFNKNDHRHAVISRCGHSFGYTCLEQMLKKHGKCPVCNMRASVDDIVRVI